MDAAGATLRTQFAGLYDSRTTREDRIDLFAATVRVLIDMNLAHQHRVFLLELKAERERFEILWRALVAALKELDAISPEATERVLEEVDA